MGFFLVTPVGDLLLKFTKDQDIMDENLPDAIHFMGIYGEHRTAAHRTRLLPHMRCTAGRRMRPPFCEPRTPPP